MHAGGCNPTLPRRAMLGLLRGSDVSLLRDALALSTPSDAARVRAFWDTAGAERYRSLMQSYVHGANIVMVVYDVTDTNAMQTVTTWLRVVEQYKPGVVAIVGNKNDLTSHVHDLHDTLAPYRRLNWKIVTGTCSSRSRPSVQKIFHRCLDSLLAPQTPKSTPGQTVKFRKTKKMRKCCT